MAKRKRRTIQLKSDDTDHADVVAYALWLARIFGSPTRAVVHIMRHDPHYTAWRATVEWCPRCSNYAPVVAGGRSDNTVRLNAHSFPEKPTLSCPGSGSRVRRLSNLSHHQAAVEINALTELVRQSQPTTLNVDMP